MHRLVGILFLTGLVIGGPCPAVGQESPQMGFTVGLNVATVEAPGDLGVRQMAAGGIVARMPIAGPLSVQSLLLLNQKGAVVQGDRGGIRYGAGYIDLPLLLRVKLPTIGPVTPYGLGGGFGGIKIFERERAGGDLSLPLPDTGTSFFRRTNGGLSAGVSGVISVGPTRQLTVVIRYEHGLVDVAQSIDDQPYERAPFPPTAETRTWSIMLQFGV